MANSVEEQIPTYRELLQGITLAFNEFGLDWQRYPPDYDNLLKRCTSLTKQDVTSVFAIAIIFTILRIIITNAFSKPFASWLILAKSDVNKFSESVWKFLIYSLLWGYSLHVIVLSGRYDFFQKPCLIMNFTMDVLETTKVPTDIYLMYIFQIGFYLHSLYGTLFLDVWRKDSIMMLFHHFLTILLLYFSFCMRYYKIGALVLLLHDISDILLEVTKFNVYLRTRGGRDHMLNEVLSTLGFASFAISWGWCRLYWFPLKVLHSTNYGVYQYHLGKNPKMYLPFNCMLLMLQFLHIYWFYFILVFLFKVATGQTSSVQDIREYDSDGKMSKDNKNNHEQNNYVSSTRTKKIE